MIELSWPCAAIGSVATAPPLPDVAAAVEAGVAVDDLGIHRRLRHADAIGLPRHGREVQHRHQEIPAVFERRMSETTLFSLSLQSIHWKPVKSKSTWCSAGSAA